MDFHRGKITLRKAIVLTMQLPPGARIWREMGGPLSWTPGEYMDNRVLHRLDIANWQRSADGRKNRNQPKEGKPPEFAFEREQKQARLDAKVEKYRAKMEQNQARAVRAERSAPPKPEPV